MIKWKLMLTTLPWVAAVVLLKLVMERIFGLTGWVEFSDISPVLAAGAFLIGFMLAGTMADYKESEKLPGEVAANLEMLEELYVLAAAQKPALDLKQLQRSVLTLTDTIKDWLVKKKTSPQMFAALTDMNATFVVLDKAGAGADSARALPHLTALRRSVSRIDVISRTGFLPPAYALLEVLLTMILVLMMVAKFKSPVAEFVFIPVVSLLNIYMLRLIKDIDDPFDFAPDGSKRGGAEVDLFPIDEYRERLAARVG